MPGLQSSLADLDQMLPDLSALEAEARSEPSADQEYFHSNVAAYVRRCWDAARMAKEEVEQELLRCLRQREGIYDPHIWSAIKEMGGSEVYMMLTQLKCRATEAWINDILWQPGEIPFGVDPTSIPEIPSQVHEEVVERVHIETEQMLQSGIVRTQGQIDKRIEDVEKIILEEVRKIAKERADRMREYIADLYQEGDWIKEMKSFISCFVTFPTAFYKGPYTVKENRLKWSTDNYGRWVPVVEKQIVRRFRNVSPFDAYPAPNAKSLQDGYFIEVMRLRRKALYKMIGVPGYDETAIRKVINEYGDPGYRIQRGSNTEREVLEGRPHEELGQDNTLDTINFWGEVRGSWLLEWGVDPSLIEDEDDDYEANVMMVGQHVIKCVLNPHPLGHRPYACASLDEVDGKIWNKGMCQLIRDIQDMCNSTARALANNMALSSGPMVEIIAERLAEGEDVTTLFPWRQFQTKESRVGSGGSARAINFFQPDSNASELMQVYRFFASLADEYSGIPPYAHGMNIAGGAASTASGLQMLMNSTARGVKEAVSKIDRVIEQITKATFQSVMLNDDVEHIKGDLKIMARGSKALLNREQQNVRRTEFLQVITNDIDNQIVGPEGRRKLLWDMLKGIDLDPSDILPTKDELASLMAGMPPPDGMRENPPASGPPQGRQTDGAGSVAGGGDIQRQAA